MCSLPWLAQGSEHRILERMMKTILETLGWVGWIIGAVCLFAFLYQRDVNRERERQEAAEREKAEGKDAAQSK